MSINLLLTIASLHLICFVSPPSASIDAPGYLKLFTLSINFLHHVFKTWLVFDILFHYLNFLYIKILSSNCALSPCWFIHIEVVKQDILYTKRELMFYTGDFNDMFSVCRICEATVSVTPRRARKGI